MPGVRILEVRQAYCSEDFDWQQAQRLTGQAIQEANVRLLRRHAARAFGASLSAGGGGGGGDGDGGSGSGSGTDSGSGGMGE